MILVSFELEEYTGRHCSGGDSSAGARCDFGADGLGADISTWRSNGHDC